MARVARFLHNGAVQTAINLGEGWRELQGSLFGDYSAGAPVEVPDSPRLSPVDPPAIYCIGLNYRAHAAEVGLPLPEYPVLFTAGIPSTVYKINFFAYWSRLRY